MTRADLLSQDIMCVRGKLFCGSSGHQPTPGGMVLLVLSVQKGQAGKNLLLQSLFGQAGFKENSCEHPSRDGQEQRWQKWYGLVWREPDHLAYPYLEQRVYLCLRPSRDGMVSA